MDAVPTQSDITGASSGSSAAPRIVAIFAVTSGFFAVLAIVGWLAGMFDNGGESLAQKPGAIQQARNDVFDKSSLFADWSQIPPSVAIMLSGERHGYLQPCGCSSPQYGGMARLYNIMQIMKQRGWPVVGADLGDLNQKDGPQALLKYRYAMRAYDAMGFSAVTVGEYERVMPLIDILAEYALNNATPKVVCANLLDREKGGRYNATVHEGVVANKHQGPPVGFTSLTGRSVEKKVNDQAVRFNQNSKQVLASAIRNLKDQGAQVFVLLYQGTMEEARACAEYWDGECKRNAATPPLHVLQCLTRGDLAPGQPVTVGNTMIVEVGHKGKEVVAVGAFRVPGSTQFTLKYQMIEVGPEFDTPAGKESANRVMQIMEEYAREVKSGNYLAQFMLKPRDHNPVQVNDKNASYVGSDTCKICHEHAFKIWSSPQWADAGAKHHAAAYETLSKATNPSLRQYDGECIKCHTVGFEFKTGFENEIKTPDLKNVGCESCHGPGSSHVAKPRDAKMQVLINPFKYRGQTPEPEAEKGIRLGKIEMFCQKCHDLDNDNSFRFDKKWPLIEHMNPPQGK
jgi:hypothetical protein